MTHATRFVSVRSSRYVFAWYSPIVYTDAIRRAPFSNASTLDSVLNCMCRAILIVWL